MQDSGLNAATASSVVDIFLRRKRIMNFDRVGKFSKILVIGDGQNNPWQSTVKSWFEYAGFDCISIQNDVSSSDLMAIGSADVIACLDDAIGSTIALANSTASVLKISQPSILSKVIRHISCIRNLAYSELELEFLDNEYRKFPTSAMGNFLKAHTDILLSNNISTCK